MLAIFVAVIDCGRCAGGSGRTGGVPMGDLPIRDAPVGDSGDAMLVKGENGAEDGVTVVVDLVTAFAGDVNQSSIPPSLGGAPSLNLDGDAGAGPGEESSTPTRGFLSRLPIKPIPIAEAIS